MNYGRLSKVKDENSVACLQATTMAESFKVKNHTEKLKKGLLLPPKYTTIQTKYQQLLSLLKKNTTTTVCVGLEGY